MDFKEIVLTKKQYEDLIEENKAIKQAEKNIIKVFKLLREKHNILLLSAGNHDKPFRQQDLFVKEVQDIRVSKEVSDNTEKLLINFIY